MHIQFSNDVTNYFGQDKINDILEILRKEFGDIDCYIPINVSFTECTYINGNPCLNIAGNTVLTSGVVNDVNIKVRLSEIFLVDPKLVYNTLLHELFHAVEMSSLQIQVWGNEETKEIYVKDFVDNTTVHINKKYYSSRKHHDSASFEVRAIEFANANSPKRSLMEKIMFNLRVIKPTIKLVRQGFGFGFSLTREVVFTSETALTAICSRTPFKL